MSLKELIKWSLADPSPLCPFFPVVFVVLVAASVQAKRREAEESIFFRSKGRAMSSDLPQCDPYLHH
jgi:hypothetical protein